MGNKGGDSTTTGYRYAFSILSGICRGPVDSVFLIRADGKVFYDLEITDNLNVDVYSTELFGGDKGEGGLYGALSLYFGKFNQIIPFGSQIRNIMVGLRVTQMRGVLTSFFDGEIGANNPYPKAWQYRIRRAVKGWKNDECWYPEKALIRLSDASVPTTADGPLAYLNYSTATSTTMVDAEGNATSDPAAAVTTVTTTYSGQSAITYTVGTGTSTTYAVPAFYNDIHAMNPAHIIYECATNPDWGRGLPRELVDNISFTSAANVLYNEGFGLCMKWSQQEDIDAFVQNVIDHIGAAVYTNPVTGLLCMRLIRNDYNISVLPTFDYEHGLLEVTSVQTASADAIANEVIVKYHSPVLDADKEARAQNIASLNSLGSFFTVTKDYSGLPTADLALRAAARELKVNSAGWKRVEFKVDRRGYAIVPGDVLKITAPDRGLTSFVLRIATVDHSEIKDGSITIVGTQDIYGWPLQALTVPQQATFQDINRFPMPPLRQNISLATYRDLTKFGAASANVDMNELDGGFLLPERSGIAAWGIGEEFLTVMAQRPSSVAISYAAYVKRSSVSSEAYDAGSLHDWRITNYLNFQRISILSKTIGVADTVFEISGEILPSNARINGCYVICDGSFAFYAAGDEEFVRLDAISQNPATGVVTVTVARGCVDTPALPHAAGSRLWAYDESGGVIAEKFGWYDNVFVKCLTHTVSRGDLDPALATTMSIIPSSRAYRPYSGAGFKVNGHFRDQIPPQSGDLVCTWHHRDRIAQAEHLIGEEEDDTGPEPGTLYGIIVWYSIARSDGSTSQTFTGNWSIPFIYSGGQVGSTGTRDTTLTLGRDELIREGCVTGPMRLIFYTGRSTPYPLDHQQPTNYWSAFNSASTPNFQYIVDDPVVDTDTSGGFNFDFDNNFDGGVA